MRFSHLVGLGIFLAVTYFFFMEIFIIAIILIVSYISYKVTKILIRWRTPKGMRIKHGLLRAHLETKYGKREGKGIYTEIVKELKGKGYR